jgi:hypothetical protein
VTAVGLTPHVAEWLDERVALLADEVGGKEEGELKNNNITEDNGDKSLKSFD